MADVYASAVGTTVLQIREIPVCPPGLEREYNRRPYEERGWCCFEDAVSREVLARLRVYPLMAEALRTLPQKVLILAGGTTEAAAEADELDGRVAHVIERIGRATFTGNADRDAVPDLYKDYVGRIASTLQQTIALASSAVAVCELPPMPKVATDEAMRAWLRA